MQNEQEQQEIEQIMISIEKFINQGSAIHYNLRLLKDLNGEIKKLKDKMIKQAVKDAINYDNLDDLTIKGL